MKSLLHTRIDAAAPGRPWLVFGNSLMTDMHIWDGQVEALGSRYNILRYDQRGHGRSPVIPTGPNFDGLAQDLISVMDGADVGTCTYVGLSMGVPTGLAAYRHAPSRFRAMVLVDGQARSTATSDSYWTERMAFARHNGMDRLAEETVLRWLRPGRQGTVSAGRLLKMLAATPLEGFLAVAGILKSYDESNVLDGIEVPVAIIVGADDGALPATMKVMSERIPQARYATLPDSGHVPNFERPKQFNDMLLAFFEVINL